MKCVIFSILLASALAQEVTLPNVSPVSLPEPQVPLEALTNVLDQLVAALGLSSIKPEGVTLPSVDGVTLPSLDGVTVPGRAKRDILPGATGLPTDVPSTNALTELLQKIVAALSHDGVTFPSADGITVPSVDGVTLPSRSKRQVDGVTGLPTGLPSTPLDELVQQLKDLLEKIQSGAVTLPALDGITLPSVDGVTVPSVDGVTVPSRSKRQVESVTGLPTVPSTNVLTDLIEKIKSLLSLDGVTLPSIDGVTVPSVDRITLPSVDGVTLPSRSKRQVDGVTVPSTDGIEGLFQQLKELLEKLQGRAGVTGLPISRATRLPVTLPVDV